MEYIDLACQLRTKYCNSSRLTTQNHGVLFEQLAPYATSWRGIGITLGFTKGELDNIESSPTLQVGTPRTWLAAMLSEWLQWTPGDSRGSTKSASLEDLKDALRKADLGVVGSRICV